MTTEHDDNDYTGLTAAEIEAMKDAGDDHGDDDVPAGDDDEATASGDSESPAAASTDKPAAQSEQEPAKEDTEQAKPAEPIYVAKAPDNADERLSEIRTETKALRKRWEDGELSDEEYDNKVDALEAEREKIKTAQIQAQVSADMIAQQTARDYRATVNAFFGSIKAQGFDYQGNADALKDLDARVKALAPLYKNEPGDWRKLLNAAHKLVAEERGIKLTQAKASAEQQPSKSRAPALEEVPPTVVRGPSAGGASVNGGEFAHLDKLTGVALEKAIAKMTPDELERWAG